MRPFGTTAHTGAAQALIALVGAAIFFAAAKLLPPINTRSNGVAPAAGYTNQLLPLLGILFAAALAMGIWMWRTSTPPPLPAPPSRGRQSACTSVLPR